MITIQTKPRLSLHEAVIAEVKLIYGDVPVQLSGRGADIEVKVDPLFDSAELKAQLKAAINNVFATRGIGVDINVTEDEY